MTAHKIAHVRAFTVGAGGGADYHDQQGYHWIDDHIATPMSRYPDYRAEPPAASASTCWARWWSRSRPTTAPSASRSRPAASPAPGSWSEHLARFLEGALVTDIEKIWDQMFRSTLFYGRKGLVLNVISGCRSGAVRPARSRCGRSRCYALLGGAVRDELIFYATGARPDLAQQMGFIGGKLPLHHGPAEGEDGLRANIEELAAMRDKVGEDFWLMCDCWMASTSTTRVRLAAAAHEYGLKWLEEALIPDDYWGYAELRQNGAARDADHDRRARGDPVGVPHVARDGLRRHPAAGRRLVRRDHRADQDLRARRRARRARRAARVDRVYCYHFVVTRTQQPVRRVPDDGARGR